MSLKSGQIGQTRFRHGWLSGVFPRLSSRTVGHLSYKPVPKLWQSLDVAGPFRIVAQRRADLIDREVDPALVVDERGFAPEMALNVPPADHLPVTVQEQQEDLEGLGCQLDPSSALDELIGRPVDLEDAKSECLGRVGRVHGNLPRQGPGL